MVEGIYAVARKERRRTRGGAPYLALELVDPSGRIEARVWSDVELLDGRFGEGDAVRVLGRVERFRDRLQLDVRSVEAAEADPAELAPALRRDAAELDGFFEFLAGEISHPGLRTVVGRFVEDEQIRAALRGLPAAESHHAYAGGLLEHTVGVATLCREATQLHPRLRGDLILGAALPSDMCTSACASSSSAHQGWAQTRGPNCSMRLRRTTTREPPEPPRPPCSTTLTSSTPSPRRARWTRAPGRGARCRRGGPEPLRLA